MSKALNTLINDGVVKTPHLLLGTKEGGGMLPYEQKEYIAIGDIHSGYWELAKSGCSAWPTHRTVPAANSLPVRRTKAAAKSGTAQVFSYETYNASKLAERLRDHKLMIAYAPYDNPESGGDHYSGENGGAGRSRYSGPPGS